MKKLLKFPVFLAVFLIGPWRPAAAENPILAKICSAVDCLNNATAKTGWSFSQKEEYAGGFTDLEQKWYLSPAPGFDVPVRSGGMPNLDINAVFKLGKLLSDKVPPIHNLVNSDPFVQGLMKYATIGESGSYDYSHGRWYDLSWVGATVSF